MFAHSPWHGLSKACKLALIAFGSCAFSYSATVEIHPGQNIPTVVSQHPAGTTYLIYPGTYRLTQHIVPKTGDQFVGQTACAPPTTSCSAILTGSRAIGASAVFDGKNYKVTGQNQQGVISLPSKVCQPGYLACNRPEDLFFDGVPLQHLNASSLPTIGSKQWWFDYANNVIYFHDNPAGHTVETSVLDTAFLSSANNVTIRYLTIRGFASPLQRAGIESSNGNLTSSASANWTIDHCEAYNNHGAGVRIAYGMKIKSNYLHDNGTLGIVGGTDSSSPSNVLVQGNTINHNNYARMLSGAGAGGFKVGHTAGLVIRNNTVSNNDGTGIHFDTTSQNPLVDGNIVTNNAGGGGIEYEVSVTSAVIRNNIVQKNVLPDGINVSAAGIGSYASTGASMYCNVVELPNLKANSHGIMVVGSNRGYNPFSPYQYLMSTANNFHHNTVIWDSGSTGLVGFSLSDPSHQPNFFNNNGVPDYNTYHLPSLSTANFIYDNNGSGTNTRKTFTEYQAAGADVHGSADANNNSGFPRVRITAPADQASFTSSSITVNATATDNSGINRVQFYVDWVLKATVTGSPYSFTYSNPTSGTHTITAMAHSNAGISACFAVTVKKQ